MTDGAAADRAGRRRTIAGALFVLAFLGVALWVMQEVSDRQALDRCLAERRRDCGAARGTVPPAGDRRYVPTR